MSYLPDKWIKGMIRHQRDLKELHGYNLLDNDLILYLLENVRHEYNSALVDVKRNIKQGNPVDIE